MSNSSPTRSLPGCPEYHFPVLSLSTPSFSYDLLLTVTGNQEPSDGPSYGAAPAGPQQAGPRGAGLSGSHWQAAQADSGAGGLNRDSLSQVTVEAPVLNMMAGSAPARGPALPVTPQPASGSLTQ